MLDAWYGTPIAHVLPHAAHRNMSDVLTVAAKALCDDFADLTAAADATQTQLTQALRELAAAKRQRRKR